jgi:calcineurin-like phosphoesterase family protein
MNFWFTSDFHFGHANIIKYSNRPFVDTIEMDETILRNLNRKVKPDDILYFLGDFLFGQDKIRRFFNYRSRIKCNNIIAIWGNHDDVIRKDNNIRQAFSWSGDFKEAFPGGKRITLCHYAMKIWNKSHHRAYHLYGHSHGSLPDDPTSCSFDVGVDTELFGHTRFTPYSLEEVVEIMTKHKRFVPVDHHNTITK